MVFLGSSSCNLAAGEGETGCTVTETGILFSVPSIVPNLYFDGSLMVVLVTGGGDAGADSRRTRMEGGIPALVSLLFVLSAIVGAA